MLEKMYASKFLIASLAITVGFTSCKKDVPVTGVTVYVAVWKVLVGLTSVPLIFAAAVPVAPPVIPPVTTGKGHE